MKVNKKLLDIVDVGTDYGTIICCAIYLNKKKADNAEIGVTVHEQVALLTLKGNDAPSIAKKTGFETKSVCSALFDITAYCGARETA